MDAFKRLSPQELSRVTIEEMPVSAFSASFVRKLVKLGMKDKFDDVYRPYLAQEKIDHLYEIISQGLSKPDPTSKSSTIKPQKYTYPIVRGDEQFNEIIQIISEKAAKKSEKKTATTTKTKKGGKKKRKTHRKSKKSNKSKKYKRY
jgi:hypothetical protein